MSSQKKNPNNLIWFLQERAKELNCLYEVEEILNKPEAELEEVCWGIVKIIPPGWQYPEVCQALINIDGATFHSDDFKETIWVQSVDIMVQDKVIGKISVYYSEGMPNADQGPFLKEETKLLETIADRLGHFMMYKRMKQVFHEYQTARKDVREHRVKEWRVAMNLLRQTDKNLFHNISRRMLNYLSWSGIDEAEQLLKRHSTGLADGDEESTGYDNRPHEKDTSVFSDRLSDETFRIASTNVKDEQILALIRKWIQEDKVGFLTKVLNQNLPMAEVADSVRRYKRIALEGINLSQNTKRGIQVALIRRFLSDHTEYVNIAKDFVEIDDFHELIHQIIISSEGHGKLGGKGAGLFLAEQIIRKSSQNSKYLEGIKVPKTWYIPSGAILDFLAYNNLSDVIEQKYKDINQVRLEYPHIVQTFKNCHFSTEVLQGLSLALDDFGDRPLIVRSSSLLEDRAGAAFSGKYKSLFLANQGEKQGRLEALTDAISEVYASVFGPDPIEYRAERGLLDFIEEMGIMIQEVVGNRVGDYFIPTFAGVAFSRNEFRWSPRIKREDGLLRLVPGLGTRAVDRTSDDYPVLIAPGQTGLRVNITIDEIVRYSPKKMDVINLKTNTFETINIRDLLKAFGDQIPGIDKIISIFDGHHIRKPLGKNIDFECDDLVVTFEGLVGNTQFINQIQTMLKLIEEKLGMPVDIEFASDGKDFYLLQCRPQSYGVGSSPSPIPKDISKDKIVFSANRYVSNGRVPDITHVVYVDPSKYDELSDPADLAEVGRAVGNLNKLLPRRRFILMGPGRWGSRGDIKLGVRVTYSDINNTAVLIEIARKKGNYLPDLSFGTHFFQDLVEAEIRYLPLYPDDDGIIFNENFLRGADNILPDVLPEFAHLEDTIRLIDIPRSTGGRILRVLMNADLDEAMGVLAESSSEGQSSVVSKEYQEKQPGNFWAWRLRMAEHIASRLDPQRFGVKGLYVFGSTKNATAGPGSDIDMLVHFQGAKSQREELMLWLEGWSLCLDEMNYLQTGFKTGGLLDVHIVTDEDIANKTSYAVKIGAITDAARPLPLQKHQQKIILTRE